ncbi:hypothetical protein CHS0354_004376 [Potamilus streckersoni]|uniref:C1q domain-containing protein n=1 Tax=Potamilus streckersoni TaxID=2493646 RepID=A0AAE0SZT2_9BIVA|nr:hypothetical protein CHS0354_004376 [Potamilus streckersoni]
MNGKLVAGFLETPQSTVVAGDITYLQKQLNDEKAKRMVLENELKMLKQEFSEMKAARASTVGFKARLSETLTVTHPDEKIVYNNVLTNVGECYNKTNGVFEAKVNGTYLFSVVACSASNHFIALNIVRNGDIIGNVLAGDNTLSDCGTEVTVMSLVAGDKVWVQRQRGDVLFSLYWNSFSGVMV